MVLWSSGTCQYAYVKSKTSPLFILRLFELSRLLFRRYWAFDTNFYVSVCLFPLIQIADLCSRLFFYDYDWGQDFLPNILATWYCVLFWLNDLVACSLYHVGWLVPVELFVVLVLTRRKIWLLLIFSILVHTFGYNLQKYVCCSSIPTRHFSFLLIEKRRVLDQKIRDFWICQ